MKKFKDFGIQANVSGFVGDKIKIERLLNREITVVKFKIEPSKFEGLRLVLQLLVDNTDRVVFTGSATLREQIQQVKPEDFPFITTIEEQNDHFVFK